MAFSGWDCGEYNPWALLTRTDHSEEGELPEQRIRASGPMTSHASFAIDHLRISRVRRDFSMFARSR